MAVGAAQSSGRRDRGQENASRARKPKVVAVIAIVFVIVIVVVAAPPPPSPTGSGTLRMPFVDATDSLRRVACTKTVDFATRRTRYIHHARPIDFEISLRALAEGGTGKTKNKIKRRALPGLTSIA